MENKLRKEIKEIINKLKQKHYVMSAHFEGVRDFEVALAEELETLIDKHYVRKDEVYVVVNTSWGLSSYSHDDVEVFSNKEDAELYMKYEQKMGKADYQGYLEVAKIDSYPIEHLKTNTDKEELPDLSKIKPKMIDVEETVRLAEEIRKEQGDTDKEGE